MMYNFKTLTKNVFSANNGTWEYFLNVKEKPPYKITGKYLFFSEERKKLIEIAVNEIETNGFHEAKINSNNKKIGKDYVLCLYYKNDNRKFELYTKYVGIKDVKYRFWKSDEDTLSGKYSKEFLDELPKKERKRWTKSKN